MAKADLQGELEALRRELRRAPAIEEEPDAVAASAAPSGDTDTRSQIERTLRDLQDRLGEVSDEAEEAIAANPFASVAAAFLLGVLVANFMSRGK